VFGGVRRLLVVGFAALCLTGAPAAAEKDGIDSTFYNNGVVGCGSPELNEQEGCHADPESDLVQVTVAGPDFIAEAGGAGAFMASASCVPPLVCGPIEGQQRGAGINVLIDPNGTTSDCALDAFPTAENNQLVAEGPVLTHRDAENPPPTGSIGVYSYQFLLVDCQTPGTVRLLIAMNTFNFDGESTGDAWNQTVKTVTVPESAGAALAAAALASLAWARRRRRIV
jgi:uncharacterized protein (TIGR03382 family)